MKKFLIIFSVIAVAVGIHLATIPKEANADVKISGSAPSIRSLVVEGYSAGPDSIVIQGSPQEIRDLLMQPMPSLGSSISAPPGTPSAIGAAPAGFAGAWETVATNLLSPTSTSAGIIVRASSTIDSNLRVSGSLNATSTVTDNLSTQHATSTDTLTAGANFLGQLSVTQGSATRRGIGIQAAGSATANLLANLNSSGAFLSGFTAAGGLLINISSSTALNIQNGSGSNIFQVNTTGDGNATSYGSIAATGVTATSTITNALQLGSTAGNNRLKVVADRNFGATVATDGLVSIVNTQSTGLGLSAYSALASASAAPLVNFETTNSAFDEYTLRVASGDAGFGAIKVDVPQSADYIVGYTGATQYFGIDRGASTVNIQTFNNTPLTINSQGNNVTFGDAVTIDGRSDEVQLIVQSHSTQTTYPFVVEQSDGTDVFTSSSGGDSTTTDDFVSGTDTKTGTTTVAVKADTTGGNGSSCFELMNVEGVKYRIYINGSGNLLVETGSCE